MRIGQRIVMAIARDRAVRALVDQHGLKPDRAAALVAAVSDAKVTAAAVAAGALFDGSILSAIMAWFQSHPDAVDKLIQIIVTLVLAMLG